MNRSVEVLVIGAGPAGLATATSLARAGVEVEVLEREPAAGGIPRHTHHTGFGVRDLHRVLTGPEYADALVERAVAAGADVRTGVCVTGWEDGSTVRTTGSAGPELVTAAAVVLATGARERPRPARWVAGDRPPGVYTTGELQQSVALALPVGRSAVVVGAEHVSFSAVLTLAQAGVEVVAMVTRHARQQSYAAVSWAARVSYGFPVLTGQRVTRIVGRRRLAGVELAGPDGRRRMLACDTVVFTGEWVTDNELARARGIAIDSGSTGPVVDTALRSNVPGVFAAGNLVHPVVSAGAAAADGRTVATSVLRTLAGQAAQTPSVGFSLGDPLAWVAPGRVPADRVRPPRNRFVVWAREPRGMRVVEVRQRGRLLWSGRRVVLPGRPTSLPAWWLPDVQVPGPEVSVTLHY